MSVHGEFERYAARLCAKLRGHAEGSPEVDAIERVALNAKLSLSARANSVLEMDWMSIEKTALQTRDEEAADLVERLRAICHIIVGR